MELRREILLAGNPNCGKSSLFNLLTGLHQKTGNVPGTTIDVKKGSLLLKDNSYVISDLPGAYSLNADGLEEKLAVDYIIKSLSEENIQGKTIVYVASEINLRRNLLLFSQLSEMNVPMVLVLTMHDMAIRKGIQTDVERLSKELGIPVLLMNPVKGEGLDQLKDVLTQQGFHTHYLFNQGNNDAGIEQTLQRFKTIDVLLSRVQRQITASRLRTKAIDKILLHQTWGVLIFLLAMMGIFQSVFYLAEFPMSWIELGFSKLNNLLNTILPDSTFRKLITGGLIPGISGVVVFVPQIVILFFLLTLLDDSGYMSRITYMMDWPMRKLGLSGKSVFPLISASACAIPAIMSARSIENRRSRLVTLLVTPLIPCSARLPVYVLLSGLIIPSDSHWFIFDLRGLLLFAMYILGFAMSLFMALLMSYFIKEKGKGIFLLEMPEYHIPNLRNVGTVCYRKASEFVFEAGKIILVVSVLLWFLASFGMGDDWKKAQQMPETNRIEQQEKSAQMLQHSFAGFLGQQIEPVIRPLGFDWKIGIAIITSFAAREVFVGTLSTIYGLGNEEDNRSLRVKMSSDVNAEGQRVFGFATVFSLMIFYAFAMQCMSTLAIMKKETASWKWPAIQFVIFTALAWLASWLTYQLFS